MRLSEVDTSPENVRRIIAIKPLYASLFYKVFLFLFNMLDELPGRCTCDDGQSFPRTIEELTGMADFQRLTE